MTRARPGTRGVWLTLVALLLALSLVACDTANSAGDDVEPWEIQEVPGGGDVSGEIPGQGGGSGGTEDEASGFEDSELDTGTQPGGSDGTQAGQEDEPDQDQASETAPGEGFGGQPLAACSAEESHPIAEAIAVDFEASYDEIMAWTCDGYAFKDILLALQTNALTGQPAADLLPAAEQDGWQQVWQQGELGADPCTAEHPLTTAIARTYNGDQEQVTAWRCDEGLGFGEIMLALQTAELGAEAPGTLVERRLAGDTWAEVWQELNVIDEPADAGPPAEELSDG